LYGPDVAVFRGLVHPDAFQRGGAGGEDVVSDSGGFVKYRTFVENITVKSGGRAAAANIAPTTGTYQFQNNRQRRGVVFLGAVRQT
jgi:hypothetical protein